MMHTVWVSQQMVLSFKKICLHVKQLKSCHKACRRFRQNEHVCMSTQVYISHEVVLSINHTFKCKHLKTVGLNDFGLHI